MSQQVWIIYDSRAAQGDTDDASVYESCESKKEALCSLKDWPDGVLFEYDLVNNEAINERRVI